MSTTFRVPKEGQSESLGSAGQSSYANPQRVFLQKSAEFAVWTTQSFTVQMHRVSKLLLTELEVSIGQSTNAPNSRVSLACFAEFCLRLVQSVLVQKCRVKVHQNSEYLPISYESEPSQPSRVPWTC